MSALAVLSLFLAISSGLSYPEKGRSNIRPEYLDHLLDTQQYELFAKVMNIPDSFVRPKEGERSDENLMFNKDLEFGDIMPDFGRLKEESRSSIRFNLYPGYKWPNGTIPYYIRASDFTERQLEIIINAINYWNSAVKCLKLQAYSGEPDYVFVYSGTGCWSYLGRTGGQQLLSLQENGCVWPGTVIHEFQHAAGFHHEQTRLDRDDWIEILWGNIPEDWHSQYEMTDSRYFDILLHYDYYSIMHYPMKAPGTNKDAFRVKDKSIDQNRIGKGTNFTQTDIDKINRLYCGCDL